MNNDWITKKAEEAVEKDLREFKEDKRVAIKIIPWKDFVSREFEEPKWVVKNMIPEKGLAAIAGSPESYKSFFTEYLIIKVARGESLLGRFETTKTPVLIIDQENISAWLQKRLTQLSQDEDIPVHIFDKDASTFDLFDDNIFGQVLKFIEENSIGLVVIDTLRLAHGSEENSSTNMKPVFDRLKEIAKAAAVLFIQHNRKADKFYHGSAARGEDMMGSQLIRGVVDYQLTFTNIGERTDGIPRIKIAQTKARYTRPFKSFEVSLEEPEDGRLEFVYAGEVEEEKLKREDAKEAILALLEEGNWKRQDIIDQLHADDICSSRTTEEALKELKDEGKARHTGSKPHIYSLVESEETNIPHLATTNSNYGIAESLEMDLEDKK